MIVLLLVSWATGARGETDKAKRSCRYAVWMALEALMTSETNGERSIAFEDVEVVGDALP